VLWQISFSVLQTLRHWLPNPQYSMLTRSGDPSSRTAEVMQA
jgi:hypothetical protein